MSINKTILVVDDDLNLLEMIGESLAEQGYDVLVAAHPDEALRKLSEIDVRFALLDYDLCVPGMTGVDLAQKIRFQHPDIIILIMTGYQNIKYAVDAMRNFKFDYMIKPFRVDQVISSFERSLREYELVEENKNLYRSIIDLEKKISELREQMDEKSSSNSSVRVISKASKKLISNSKAADIYKEQQNG